MGTADRVGERPYGRGMESTWESRDLPVLQAIVGICDETGAAADRAAVAERTGLNEGTVRAAFFALAAEQPAFFRHGDTSRLARRDIDYALDPTGHARRTVGSWPTPENLADRIVAALNEAAEQAPTPDDRTKLKKAAEAVSGVGKGVLTGVLTHVLTQGI